MASPDMQKFVMPVPHVPEVPRTAKVVIMFSRDSNVLMDHMT